MMLFTLILWLKPYWDRLKSHRTERKKKHLGSPVSLENCQGFPTCDSSALGGSFTTSKRSVTSNLKAFLLAVTFNFLNRGLSFFKRICRKAQIEKLFKILLQHVQLHGLHTYVGKSPW